MGRYRADSAIPGRVDDLEEALVKVKRLIALRALVDQRIRELLTKDFTFTLSGGAKPLTGATLSAILPEGLRKAKLYVTGYDEPAAFYEDYYDYNRGTTYPDIPRWTFYNGTVLVRCDNDEVPVAAADCNLKDAIYKPEIDEPDTTDTTLPDDLVEDFIQMLVMEMLDQGQGSAAQPQPQPQPQQQG